MRHTKKEYLKIENRNYKSRKDYLNRWGKVAHKLNINIKDVEKYIVELYTIQLLSSNDINKLIKEQTNQEINTKTIARIIKGNSVARTSAEAFKLKVLKGEINWKYKENKLKLKQLTPKKRYEIMKRDNFKCVLCGSTAEKCPLEIDHITPRCSGGTNNSENLRTLCHNCNTGKRIIEREI